MIFGVENDKRHIVGTDFKYDVDIKNEGVFKHYLARNLSPRIVFEFEEEYIDGKRIVVLKIPAAKSVITEFDKERYIRIGSSKEILRKFPNHEAKLWKILNNDEYLLENDRSPNQKLSFRIFKKYLEDYNIDFNQNNFYENHHMLTETGQFNFIAYMFSDQFDMSFKVVKYSGSDKKSDFIYRKEFGGGCVLKSIDKLVDYMDGTENLVRSYFDGSASRRDEFLFDKRAFREAYINSVLHNDWSDKVGPSVFVFKDHLEILSYGTPLRVQSKENFLKGISKPINAALAKEFMKFDKYEESGRGVNSILNKYDDSVFKFDENGEHFIVSLPFNELALGASNASNHAQKNNILDNVPQNVPQKSDIEIIIDAIRDNPNITRKELAEKIGKTIKTVGRILRTNPNIVYIGPSKGGHWEIK